MINKIKKISEKNFKYVRDEIYLKNFNTTNICRSDTYSCYEKPDATYDHRIRYKLHQRDRGEKILDVVRKSNNLMMFID